LSRPKPTRVAVPIEEEEETGRKEMKVHARYNASQIAVCSVRMSV